MPKDARSYTTIDVARRLGVSLQTVQRWVDAGHLKAWKTLGGHRRIDAASADLLFDEQEQRLGAQPSPPTPAAVSVVVVDDNPLDRALLVMLVRQALPEARIEAAANGFQGLVIIGKIAPDIVITDVHMPNMDGLEMLRSLLDQEARPRAVIVVSALSKRELAARGPLPAGVAAFPKPVDQAALIAALRAAS